VSPDVHRAAAEGFGVAADAYERGRPTFPPAAVAALVHDTGIGPGSVVVDLAAGTGKLTRHLVPIAAEVLAVEPVDAMRSRLEATVPGARPVAATAESMPFDDGSIDVVTVAQAFHWFDAPRALDEIARVLRSGGSLGLIWNVRDEGVPWVAELTRIMEPYRGDTPTHRTGAWRRAIDDDPRFTPLVEHTFPSEQLLSPGGVIDRVVSVSFVAALPDDERRSVERQVRALLESDDDTRGRREVVLPYRTDVQVCATR
jgi:SAM-dependent methyltransferase